MLGINTANLVIMGAWTGVTSRPPRGVPRPLTARNRLAALGSTAPSGNGEPPTEGSLASLRRYAPRVPPRRRVDIPNRPRAERSRRWRDSLLSPVGHNTPGSSRFFKEMGRTATKAELDEAMGIDWMNRDERSLAIPPAYTEYIGAQLLAACGVPRGQQ